MAAEERQPHSDIEQALRTEPYRFNFFKAVQLLELFSGGKTAGAGLSPADDPVHFSVRPGFCFPASDIQRIEEGRNGSAPRMTVNFMGLVGPKGVLPDWYNAHARQRNDYKDYTLTDFLDLFHHRLISLFYRAWKKYRLVENHRGDASDPISGIMAGLAGISELGRESDSEFYQYVQRRLTFFCGLAARNVPTAAAVESIVAHATGAQVRVEQFIERLIPIHRHDRTCLGRSNGKLGTDALCGRHIWDAGSFFRVHIGPMSWKRYLAFAPRGRNLGMVKRLIAHLAGVEYEFEVRLIIRGAEIPALALGDKRQALILGRTAVLRRPEQSLVKDVTVYAAGDVRSKGDRY